MVLDSMVGYGGDYPPLANTGTLDTENPPTSVCHSSQKDDLIELKLRYSRSTLVKDLIHITFYI